MSWSLWAVFVPRALEGEHYYYQGNCGGSWGFIEALKPGQGLWHRVGSLTHQKKWTTEQQNGGWIKVVCRDCGPMSAPACLKQTVRDFGNADCRLKSRFYSFCLSFCPSSARVFSAQGMPCRHGPVTAHTAVNFAVKHAIPGRQEVDTRQTNSTVPCTIYSRHTYCIRLQCNLVQPTGLIRPR